MLDKYRDMARHEYSPFQRAAALAPMGILFLLLLPAALYWVSSQLDRWLGWPRFSAGWVSVAIAVLLIATGLPFALWSIAVQFDIGRGTPAPLMPTQTLIVQPPYTYTRNPMVLGTILAYLGVAIGIGSPSAVLLALLGSALLLGYVKAVEEKELALRFGQPYLDYCRRTPFLIPRPRRDR